MSNLIEKSGQFITSSARALSSIASYGRYFVNSTSKFRILIILGLILAGAAIAMAFTYPGVAITSEVSGQGLIFSGNELSTIPQTVIDDARELSLGIFGNSRGEYDDFVNQLLALYTVTKGTDFVILYNPGGWGWNSVENSPSWCTIYEGINSELNELGYKSLFLNYQRTVHTLHGHLNEMQQMLAGYSLKAKELASSADFLTQNVPDLRVIIAGESNGSIISDAAMNMLEDNTQVYSIQTGPPFWHSSSKMSDRRLVVTDNGITPDVFSEGDIWTLIKVNLKVLFGMPQVEYGPGNILYIVRAPGHDYQWEYPGVYSQISDFLKLNFSINGN